MKRFSAKLRLKDFQDKLSCLLQWVQKPQRELCYDKIGFNNAGSSYIWTDCFVLQQSLYNPKVDIFGITEADIILLSPQ